MSHHRNVVVWELPGGAARETLGRTARPVGLTVVSVPPVFLVDAQELVQVQAAVGDAAFLLSQPIRDEYRVPGCGTDQLAACLPRDGQLIRLSAAFDSAAFPFQALAHDGKGERVAAPVTDYHDLRLIIAAALHRSTAEVLERWPEQPSVDEFHAHAAYSWHNLVGREALCHVRSAEVIRNDAALFTANHPSNQTLTHTCGCGLAAMGITDTVKAPAREYLGATRTAVEQVPADELGWAMTAWQIAGAKLEWLDVVDRHLDFYRQHPDIVADSLTRFAERLDLLGLAS